MSKLKYKLIKEGILAGQIIPLNLVFVDLLDVNECGIDTIAAMHKIAEKFDDPTTISVFDMDAVTTTSDGLMIEGAIVAMAASDRKTINPDFGYLEMMEIPYSKQRIIEEPHLKQWDTLYKNKKLYMGPKNKKLPIHCAAMTGRACNNNSGTEVWNVVTMEELLLPIIGQTEIIRNGKVMIGKTGGIISVGIGMVVGEEFARIIPGRAFKCGQTAHKSGVKAQGLKSHIPLIASDKATLAKYIVQAIQTGMVPGRHIGPSPAILSVNRLLNGEIDMKNIEEKAFFELETVGFTKEWMLDKSVRMNPEEIIANADKIIPGGEDSKVFDILDVVEVKSVKI